MQIAEHVDFTPDTFVHAEMFEVATGRHKTMKEWLKYKYAVSQNFSFEKSESFVAIVIKFM